MSAGIEPYVKTEKQRGFAVDFIDGWDTYETWDTVEIGVERISPTASSSPRKTSSRTTSRSPRPTR